MTAYQYLRHLKQHGICLGDDQNKGIASNSQLNRWLKQGAVRINGLFAKPTDEIRNPIDDLVFFPGAKRQTTLWNTEAWNRPCRDIPPRT